MNSIISVNNMKRPVEYKTHSIRGRGSGSCKGGKSGRGSDGQKARSGDNKPATEGGQYPSYLRINKRGFRSIKNKKHVLFTSQIIALFLSTNNKNLTIENIFAYFKLNKGYKLKILFDKKITNIKTDTICCETHFASVNARNYLNIQLLS